MKGLRPRGGPFESRETISSEGSSRWLEVICVCRDEIGPESPQARATPLTEPVTTAFLSESFLPQSVGGGRSAHPCVPSGCSGHRPVSSTPADKLSREPGPGVLCGKALWDGGASPRTQPLDLATGHSSWTPASHPRASSRASCSHHFLPPKAQGACFCFSVGLTEIETWSWISRVSVPKVGRKPREDPCSCGMQDPTLLALRLLRT